MDSIESRDHRYKRVPSPLLYIWSPVRSTVPLNGVPSTRAMSCPFSVFLFSDPGTLHSHHAVVALVLGMVVGKFLLHKLIFKRWWRLKVFFDRCNF